MHGTLVFHPAPLVLSLVTRCHTSSRGAPREVAHAAHRVGAPAREAAAHARLQPHRRERHEREEARAHRVGALPREAAARARLQPARRLGDDVLRHA